MSNPNGRATKPDRPADAAPGPADSLAAAPFDPDSGGRPAWDAAAAAVLRKGGRLPSGEPDAAAWDRLARTTVDGVRIPPLGTPALIADLPATGLPGAAPFTRGSRPADGTGWDVRALLADPDPVRANTAALAELENGSTSLWVWVGAGGTAPADLSRVLDGVLLDLAPVVVRATGASAIEAAEAFSAVLDAAAARSTDFRPAAGTSLGADPIGDALRAEADGAGSEAGAVEIVAATVDTVAALARSHGVGALVVDGTAAHEAGAGDVDELAWTLAVGAAYLRILTAGGAPVDDAAGSIEFRYAATDEQFTTLAKLRAARLLWHRVCELSQVSARLGGQQQHAVTSRPMATRYDPWVNLLRSTIAAFAAGAGGASSVTVLPFDAAIGVPEEFSRRMARNVSALLLEESHVGRVADPGGGAHAVEALTHDLADRAWVRFGEIDAAGGALAVLRDGSFRAAVDRAAAGRAAEVATRRRPLTGVSEFPLPDESVLERRPWPAAAGWDGIGWAEPFERLRDDPPTRPVLLVTLGDQAGYGPRLGFVSNLLTAGGIDIALSGPVLEPADAAAAVDREVTTVTLVLGTDDNYAGIGADVVAALRDAGVTDVLLAGKVPAALAGRVDDAVAAGDDVLTFLHRTRSRLEATAASVDPESVIS